MRTHITTRQAAGAVAVTAVAGLITVSPAFARQDPGDRPDGSTVQYPPTSQSRGPADVKVEDGKGESVPRGRTYQSDIERENARQMQNRNAENLRNKAAVNDTRKADSGVAPAPGPNSLALDSTSIEYLQIGLGALAGMAVVGGIAAAVSTHHRHAAHPA